MTAAGIAIVGFPRSGTTLMRRLLGAHPDLAAPPETGLLSAAARFLDEERIVDGVTVGVSSGLQLAGFDEADVTARVRGLVEGLLTDYAARQGRPRWVEKNPYDVFRIEAIEAIFGDTLRYVVVLRDGLDVVVSVQELIAMTDRWLDGLHPYLQRNPRPSLAVAEAWTDTTLRCLAFAARHPETAVVVRYEDLVADPLAALRTIGATIGVEFSEDVVATALGRPLEAGFGDWKAYARRSIDDSSVGRSKKLSRGHRWELVEVMRPALIAAGYEVPVLPAPKTGAAALRRHQIALAVQASRHDTEP